MSNALAIVKLLDAVKAKYNVGKPTVTFEIAVDGNLRIKVSAKDIAEPLIVGAEYYISAHLLKQEVSDSCLRVALNTLRDQIQNGG